MVFQSDSLADTNYTIRMSTSDKDRLKEFAKELNIPISYLLRIAINDFHKKIKNEE